MGGSAVPSFTEWYMTKNFKKYARNQTKSSIVPKKKQKTLKKLNKKQNSLKKI